jgi:hypothetical protein
MFAAPLFLFNSLCLQHQVQCTLAVCHYTTNVIVELSGSTNNHISQIFFVLAAPVLMMRYKEDCRAC